MATNFFKLKKGLNLQPLASAVSAEGDVAYNSSNTSLEYYNGSVRTVVNTAEAQTLTNKILSGNTATNLVSGSGTLTLNTSGTVTVPNATDTLVGKATTDTLTNKTLSGNTAATLINGSGTLALNSTGTVTLPNATDTLVGKATTDTLTNKTISTGGTNVIGATTISGTTGTTNLVFSANPTFSGAVGIGTPANITLQVSGTGVWSDSYGVQGEFIARRGNGSVGSPTALLTGEQISNFGTRGYGTTDFSGSSRTAIRSYTSQNWTDANQGALMAFDTTPNNTALSVERMRINASGNVSINNTSDTFKLDVTGTTNISGAVTLGSTLNVTGVTTLTAQPILSSLTASQAVFTDGSKGLVSNAITGSGNVVMSASPTLSGTITAAAANFSGALTGASSLVMGTSGGTRGSISIIGTASLGPKLEFDNTAASGGKLWRTGDGLTIANGTYEITNATDSKTVYRSDADGNTVLIAKLGVLAAPSASDQVAVNGTTTLTGVTQRGIASIMTGTSAGTTALTGFHAALTSAASTTVALTTGFRSASPTVGSSGTITRFNGFHDSGAQQHLATNNAAFADNATYTGNWFINNSVADPSTFAGVVSLATLKFGTAGTTGSTVNTLGTNGPNVTSTPNTWVAIQLSDGTTGYMPVWK